MLREPRVSTFDQPCGSPALRLTSLTSCIFSTLLTPMIVPSPNYSRLHIPYMQRHPTAQTQITYAFNGITSQLESEPTIVHVWLTQSNFSRCHAWPHLLQYCDHDGHSAVHSRAFSRCIACMTEHPSLLTN